MVNLHIFGDDLKYLRAVMQIDRVPLFQSLLYNLNIHSFQLRYQAIKNKLLLDMVSLWQSLLFLSKNYPQWKYFFGLRKMLKSPCRKIHHENPKIRLNQVNTALILI